MYKQRLQRRRLARAGLLLLTLVLFAPKIDPAGSPQLIALLGAVGLGQSSNI